MSSQQEKTILYVDDEEPNLFLFRANFEEKYRILTAKSGEQALTQLGEHHNEITAVISDMRMPNMNGIQFIKKARDLYNGINYYILTGYEFNNEIEQALEQQVIQKYFTKPFDTEEIAQAIDEAQSNS